MIRSLITRFGRLAPVAQALIAGHWHMLLSETRLNAGQAAKHSRTAAAGAAAVLVALGLLMAGLSLLLALALAAGFGLSPLAAGAISTLFLAAVTGLTGWLLVRSGTSGLKTQPVAPVRTIESLRDTAANLTQPNYKLRIKPMKNETLKETAERAMEAAEEQIHHARRGFADLLYSLGEKLDPNPLLSAVAGWVNSLSEPRNRERVATAIAAAGALPRRFPAPAALIGAGIGYLAWETWLRRRDSVESLAGKAKRAMRQEAEACRDAADSVKADLHNLHETADSVIHRWSDAAREAGTAVREVAGRTAQNAAKFADRTRDNAARLANGAAEAGHRVADEAKHQVERVTEFTRERPLAALAGVFLIGAAAAVILRPRR